MGALPKTTSYALPGILADIARITSVEVAIALARTHGGRRLYLPEREPKRTHPLCKLIGTKEARLVCAKLGGDTYDIPSAKHYLHWYDARRLRSQGKSYTQISRELGVNRKHVITLLDGFEPEPGVVEVEIAETSVCPLCLRKERHKHTLAASDPRQLELHFAG